MEVSISYCSSQSFKWCSCHSTNDISSFYFWWEWINRYQSSYSQWWVWLKDRIYSNFGCVMCRVIWYTEERGTSHSQFHRIMNIFATCADPKYSAQVLPDKHVVKMPLECCQMLAIIYSKWYLNWGEIYKKDGTPYRTKKGAFRNHPCTVWALSLIHIWRCRRRG